MKKISTSGANKSLVIHKTSQNNRNDIILWCIWVYLGKKSRRSNRPQGKTSSSKYRTRLKGLSVSPVKSTPCQNGLKMKVHLATYFKYM